VVNFSYVSSPVLSRKLLLMFAACVSKFRSFWRFPTEQHKGSLDATPCTTDCQNWISVPNIVLNLCKIHSHRSDSPDAINSRPIRRLPNDCERATEQANDVSLLWRHSSWVRSRTLKRAYGRPFLTVLGNLNPMLSAIVWTPKMNFLTLQRPNGCFELFFVRIHPRMTSVGESGEKIKIKKRPYILRFWPDAPLRPIGTNFGLCKVLS